MQKGYVTVFYLQMNNVEFDIFGTLTANYSVYFNITPTNINVKGLIQLDICIKRYRVSNFEFNFLKINFLVIEQYGSHATIQKWSH